MQQLQQIACSRGLSGLPHCAVVCDCAVGFYISEPKTSLYEQVTKYLSIGSTYSAIQLQSYHKSKYRVGYYVPHKNTNHSTKYN